MFTRFASITYLYIGTRDYYVSVALIITAADTLSCREHLSIERVGNDARVLLNCRCTGIYRSGGGVQCDCSAIHVVS